MRWTPPPGPEVHYNSTEKPRRRVCPAAHYHSYPAFLFPPFSRFDSLCSPACQERFCDSGRHAPDGASLPVPHGDLYFSPRPGVIPGNSYRFIGKFLRNLGRQPVRPDLRRRLPEERQGNRKRLRHLCWRRAHLRESRRRHYPQNRPQKKAPLVADEIRRPQEAHFFPANGQLLLGFPKRARFRRFTWFHPPAGEADLSPLP